MEPEVRELIRNVADALIRAETRFIVRHDHLEFEEASSIFWKADFMLAADLKKVIELAQAASGERVVELKTYAQLKAEAEAEATTQSTRRGR